MVRFLRLKSALGVSGCFAPLILPPLLLPQLLPMKPRTAAILATPRADQLALPALELATALHASALTVEPAAAPCTHPDAPSATPAKPPPAIQRRGIEGTPQLLIRPELRSAGALNVSPDRG